VRHGRYVRVKVIIDYQVYVNVPIFRFCCTNPNLLETLHRTFSLLPHWLVPYHQWGLDMMVDIVDHQQQTENSFESTKDFIDNPEQDVELSLENQQIINYQNHFGNTFNKLCSIALLKEQLIKSNCLDSNNPTGSVIKFLSRYQTSTVHDGDTNLSNAHKLYIDFFYLFQTDAFFGRYFLVGTPSQKR